MKIIFSPTKTMAKNGKKYEFTFSKFSEKVLCAIRELDDEKFLKTFKIKGKVLQNTITYYEKFPLFLNRAIDAYEGISFREIDREDEEVRKYLFKHLYILSALYGPIPANEIIAPYRLDMKTRLQIGSDTLEKYWIKKFGNFSSKEEEIINLASDEFSNIYKKMDKFIDIKIAKIVDGKIKSHSTISKKGRGMILNFMAKNNIKLKEDIKNMDFGLKYKDELSSKNTMFFEYLL